MFFDDSILQDRQTNINEGILLIGNGLMSKKRFMVEKLGYTEEEAVQELMEIEKESSISADMIDMAEQAGQEANSINPNEEPEARKMTRKRRKMNPNRGCVNGQINP